jgi:hypothetical protein
MNYHRLQNHENPIDGWAVVLQPAVAKPPVEAAKVSTAVLAVGSDPVMKADKCQFSGVCPNADLPTFFGKKLPLSMSGIYRNSKAAV